MTTLRRLHAAEERASSAEHKLRLARGRVKLWQGRANEVAEYNAALQRENHLGMRALRRLARTHLGEDARKVEVDALVGRWLMAQSKAEMREAMGANLAEMNAAIEAMRRAFGGMEDGDE